MKTLRFETAPASSARPGTARVGVALTLAASLLVGCGHAVSGAPEFASGAADASADAAVHAAPLTRHPSPLGAAVPRGVVDPIDADLALTHPDAGAAGADVPHNLSDVPAMTPDVPRNLSDVPAMTPDVPRNPTDAGALPPVGLALPAWDAATVAHVRALRDRGAAMGNRLGVFAKIGDSITESGSFLFDVGFGWFNLGAYAGLDPTIAYFRATSLAGGANSFNRSSACATAGWSTDDALAGGDDAPLLRELRAIRPAWAIVMYGTNDLDRGPVALFRANLTRIVDLIEAAGTVPALSTIPDRYDGDDREALVLQLNDAIRALAASRSVPLLDLWAALQPLPTHGVSPDRIHPNVYVEEGGPAAAYFTPAALQYGYNVRNLTAVQMLDRLRSLP